MASPQSMSNDCSPFPPGLEPNITAPASPDQMISQAASVAAKEMRAVAIENMEKQLHQLGDGENRDAIISAVRQVVLADVDVKVQEKADQLWLKGKHMVSSIQTKHKEKTQALSDDLAECLKKQQAMESENEKLKQVLANLVSRFSMMGSCFTATPKGAPSTAASTMSPNQDSIASDLFSPATFTPAMSERAPDGEGNPNFADVPAFPFPCASPAQKPATAPQLSLAEALLASPQPLSLASSLTPTPQSPEIGTGDFAASSGQEGAANTSYGYSFSFTLRKADGADLGLNVSHHEHDRVLRVEGVRSEGAIEAWNRQCAGSPFADKAVLPGDTITSVNNIMYDPKKMLEECRDRQLLKLTIYRQRTSSKSSTQLRADASEFVPGAASAAPAASSDDAMPPDVAAAAQDSVDDVATKAEE